MTSLQNMVQTEFPPSRGMVDGQLVVTGDNQILGSVKEQGVVTSFFPLTKFATEIWSVQL